jgi:hypothetical protein
MPAKSAAQTLLDKADKKATSSGGWFSSSSTKFEEAGDLYQQAANSFKIDKLFKEAGDAFAREAECREKGGESSEAANAWWNASKAYKRGFPDCKMYSLLHYRTDLMISSSGYRGFVADNHASDQRWSVPPGSGPGEGDWADIFTRNKRHPESLRKF